MVTSLNSKVEGMEEDLVVPELAIEEELRMDIDVDKVVPKLLTAEVEIKLDVEQA